MMAQFAALRKKYDLPTIVERFVSDTLGEDEQENMVSFPKRNGHDVMHHARYLFPHKSSIHSLRCMAASQSPGMASYP